MLALFLPSLPRQILRSRLLLFSRFGIIALTTIRVIYAEDFARLESTFRVGSNHVSDIHGGRFYLVGDRALSRHGPGRDAAPLAHFFPYLRCGISVAAASNQSARCPAKWNQRNTSPTHPVEAVGTQP